jgi:hypothetical protein
MQTELETIDIKYGQAGVSWAAIAAGAVVIAALSLVLVALGAGLGLSAISPWSDTGASASTFRIGTGIYVVIIAVMSSAVGGFLAARLREPWVGLHGNEVFFRDSAHGLLAWAFATVVSASVLGGAMAHIAGGAAVGAMGTEGPSPQQVYIDKLFRSDTTPVSAISDPARLEVSRLWVEDFRDHKALTPADHAYVARLVAARTGLSQADAETRVDDVAAAAKTDLDDARIGAARLSFWLTAALLAGAFAASIAAVEGGQLRDGTWNGRVLVPRPL